MLLSSLSPSGWVFPGDPLEPDHGDEDLVAGTNCHCCPPSASCSSSSLSSSQQQGGQERGVLRATVLGKLVLEDTQGEETESTGKKKKIVHVVTSDQTSAQDVVIAPGDVVTARVVRITSSQVFVSLLAVGDAPLRSHQRPAGVVRREDIRLVDTDSLVVHECFRPGDVILAQVISLGDARQYYLSTADPEYGVKWARSEESGHLMKALSWKEMQDPVSKKKELRKVAKPK